MIFNYEFGFISSVGINIAKMCVIFTNNIKNILNIIWKEVLESSYTSLVPFRNSPSQLSIEIQ